MKNVFLCCLLSVLSLTAWSTEASGVSAPTQVFEKNATEIRLQSFGLLHAEQHSDLSALVSGQIVDMSPEFVLGQPVEKGQLLARVESSQYVSLLANAKQQFADAAWQLADQQARAKRAIADWQDANSFTDENSLTDGKAQKNAQKPSSLIAREYQVTLAENRLAAAKAAVTFAQQQLSYTDIVAPFTGTITNKNIALGEYVEAGVVVAGVIDLSRIRAEFNLSVSDALMLENAKQSQFEVLVNGQTLAVLDFRILPQLSPKAQSVTVAAWLSRKQKSSVLWVNQYATAQIDVELAQPVFALPEQVFTQNNTVVIKRDEQFEQVTPKVMYQTNGIRYCSLNNSTNGTVELVSQMPDLVLSNLNTESASQSSVLAHVAEAK